MKIINEDSYLSELGLSKMGFKNTALAFLKISVLFPLIFMLKVILFLINPSKSALRMFKMVIILPFLEFFTGKSISEGVLGEYSYLHNSILKKEDFSNHTVKINFALHKSILLNSRIATVLIFISLIFIYDGIFELIGLGQLTFFALSFVTAGITLFASVVLIVIKALLVIGLFAIEMNLFRSLFVTKKEEIKDYLDEIIFYADAKNSEIFGENHAKKVKEALYEMYLTDKSEVSFMHSDIIDHYLAHEVAQVTNQKIGDEK